MTSPNGSGEQVSEAMVEAAAKSIWYAFSARLGGDWPGMDSQLVAVIQCVETARLALKAALSASMAGPVPEGRKPLTFVIQIEADNSERYAIFSTMEKAEAWAAKTPDLTHIFADLVIDMPEWGNEAVEQRQ